MWISEVGHAAIDETALIMAVDENLVRKGFYSEQAVATNMQGVDVYPFHESVILYKKGEGFPVFDASKATEYYEGIVKSTVELLKEILDKWNGI